MEERPDNGRLINYRPLLFAAVGFVCGILFAAECGFGSGALRGAAFVLASAAPAAAAAAAIFGALKRRRDLLLLSVCFILGILRVQLFAPYSDAALADPAGEERVVEGVVVSLDTTEAHARLTLKNVTVDDERAGHMLLLFSQLETAEGLEVGDGVAAVCSSLFVPGRVYGSYDERMQRLAQGISLRGYAVKIELRSRNNAPITQLFSKTRSVIEGTIDRTFGSRAPLVNAFILGIRSDIPDDVYSSYTTGGIVHVLTLSGFHVGVLTAMLHFVFPKRKRFLRAAAISAVLLLYCALTGFAPSLLRASVMCVCAVSATAFGRRQDSLSSLSLSALIILAVNPYKLFSTGFILTFAATLGIIIISSFTTLKHKRGLRQRLGGNLIITLGASAATVLISAASFGSIYPYNVLSNLVCVPLLAIAITLSFIITGVAFVLPGFAALAANVPNALLGVVEWLLGRIAMLPFARITAFHPSSLTAFLAVLLMFVLSAFVLRPLKTRIKYGACVLLLFTASAFVDIIRP